MLRNYIELNSIFPRGGYFGGGREGEGEWELEWNHAIDLLSTCTSGF